jgi:hypothetical protein
MRQRCGLPGGASERARSCCARAAAPRAPRSRLRAADSLAAACAAEPQRAERRVRRGSGVDSRAVAREARLPHARNSTARPPPAAARCTRTCIVRCFRAYDRGRLGGVRCGSFSCGAGGGCTQRGEGGNARALLRGTPRASPTRTHGAGAHGVCDMIGDSNARHHVRCAALGTPRRPRARTAALTVTHAPPPLVTAGCAA